MARLTKTCLSMNIACSYISVTLYSLLKMPSKYVAHATNTISTNSLRSVSDFLT